MLPQSRRELLKAAQEQLVAACGGIEHAAEICSYGKSTVGRWANRDTPELMAPEAMLKLQEACGKPIWAAALAASFGCKLASLAEGEQAAGDTMGGFFDVLEKFGDFSRACTDAFSDLKFTPNEADLVYSKAEALREALGEIQKNAASVRAAGGLRLVGEAG